MAIHCCDYMDQDLGLTCDIHSCRADCPDAFISEVRGGYGLIIHDGGNSVIEIASALGAGRSSRQ